MKAAKVSMAESPVIRAFMMPEDLGFYCVDSVRSLA